MKKRNEEDTRPQVERDIDTIKHELLLFREREHAWAKARADLERAVAAEQAAAAKERERSASWSGICAEQRTPCSRSSARPGC
jgi:hypothetical protein